MRTQQDFERALRILKSRWWRKGNSAKLQQNLAEKLNEAKDLMIENKLINESVLKEMTTELQKGSFDKKDYNIMINFIDQTYQQHKENFIEILPEAAEVYSESADIQPKTKDPKTKSWMSKTSEKYLNESRVFKELADVFKDKYENYKRSEKSTKNNLEKAIDEDKPEKYIKDLETDLKDISDHKKATKRTMKRFQAKSRFSQRMVDKLEKKSEQETEAQQPSPKQG